MKRNMECIAQVLLYLEKKIVIEFRKGDILKYDLKKVSLKTICNSEELSKYEKEDIFYSLIQLQKMGHISINFQSDQQIDSINDITPSGHDQLQRIHNSLEFVSN